MVSIVIVSHSLELAKGVYTLAQQMTQGKVAITIAAGIDDIDNPIGTDAIAVMEAIEKVYSDDGVVVFVDMGSAILSTDMALELLDPSMLPHIHICAAPIVEGVITASIAAMTGKNVKSVLHEAHMALFAKYELLDQSSCFPKSTLSQEKNKPKIDMNNKFTSNEFIIKNKHGIHARPAAAIVGALGDFKADILLCHNEKEVNAKSINNLTSLAIKEGDSIHLIASGCDAKQAIEVFNKLYMQNFYDDIINNKKEIAEYNQSVNENSIFEGTIYTYQEKYPQPHKRDFLGTDEEMGAFYKAKNTALSELKIIELHLQKIGFTKESNIFQAHQEMLNDKSMDEEVANLVKNNRTIESAWMTTIESLALLYKESDSQYMQARVIDAYDIGYRIMRILQNVSNSLPELTTPHIIISTNLYPSTIAQLQPRFISGIVLEDSSQESHTVLLAKAIQLPIVVGVKKALESASNNQHIYVNKRDNKIIFS